MTQEEGLSVEASTCADYIMEAGPSGFAIHCGCGYATPRTDTPEQARSLYDEHLAEQADRLTEQAANSICVRTPRLDGSSGHEPAPPT